MILGYAGQGRSASGFLYLQEVQLHGSLATEEGDEHPELCPFFVDVVDNSNEIRKWPFDDAHLLRALEGRAHLGCSGLHTAQDPLDGLGAQWGGVVAHPNKARDARGIAHDIPGLFIQNHPHQHVAGVYTTLNDPSLALAQFHLLFRGHDDVKNV